METDRNTPVYMRKDMYYCALVLSILFGCLLIASFFFTGTEYAALILFPFLLLLCLALILSVNHREYESFDHYLQRCCKPLIALTVLVVLATFFNFIISAFVMGFGSPEYRDGAYRLVHKGTFLRELTREEYLRYRRVEGRMFASFPLSFSLLALTYFSARVRKSGQGKPCVNDGSI